MLRKLATLALAIALTAGLTGTALSAWQVADSELIRVVRSTGAGATNIVASDLGSIADLSGLHNSTITGTAFDYATLGANANAGNTFVTYFAKNNNATGTGTFDMWVAASSVPTTKSRKFATLNSSIIQFIGTYQPQSSNPNVTGVLTDYTNKFGFTGTLNDTFPTSQEYSLASVATLKLYIFSNTNASTFPATTGTDTGMVIVTNADGSTTINPGATTPDPPLNPQATAGDVQATIVFQAPAGDGGSPILGYTVTATPPDGTDSNADSLFLSHVVTGLVNGTNYTFTVKARNAVGPSLPSVSSNPVMPSASVQLPGAPTGVTATAGTGKATVSFNAPASDGGAPITDYLVTSNPGGITASGISPVTVAGLTNGTAYTFTVQALNSAGAGPASDPSNSVTPFAVTAPGAPTGVSASAGNGEATVIFDAPANNGGSPVLGYTVTSQPPGGVDSNADTVSLSHVVTGLNNGTAYTFTVTAKNSIGSGSASAPSAPVTPSGPTTVPDAPTSVSATGGNAQASVSFQAPISNGGSTITGYTVTSVPSGGIDTDAGTTTKSHTVIGLTNGTSYSFRVTATNGVGTGPASAASNSIVPFTVPGAPSVASVKGGDRTATVSFSAPASNGGSAVTGYTVTSIPAGGVDSNAGSLELSHSITGLVNGTSYTFTVIATNQAGAGPASVPSGSVTPAIIPILFTVSPAAGSNGTISPALAQTAPAGSVVNFTITPAAGYQISAVTGCGGTLNGNSFATAGLHADCQVSASFVAEAALKGDLTGDGKVDVADALLCLQFAVGLKTPTPAQLSAGDVAPLVSGKPGHDLKIDIVDAVAVLQRAVGILNW
jgi:hypothetical protein